MKWELLPEHRDEYIVKLRKMTKGNNNSAGSGTGRRESFQLGSPSPRKVLGPPISLDDTPSALAFPGGLGTSRSVTPPPSSSYRVQPQEAYTPDRGSRRPAVRSDNMLSVETPKPTTSLLPPSRINNDLLTAPPNGDDPISPGPNPSAAAASTAVTPAPQRQHPRLAPPSASQLPSSYLPTSSPAPFWKYVSFGSTPAKPGDSYDRSGPGRNGPGIELNFSPLKDLQSSSPPPMMQKRPEDSSVPRLRELGSPLKDRGMFTFGTPTASKTTGGLLGVLDDNDPEDDVGGLGDFMGVDLTKYDFVLLTTSLENSNA